MPRLDLKFDEQRRPVNPEARFITRFYAMFRDFGAVEKREGNVIYKGEEMTYQDAYWQGVVEQLSACLNICRGTDFEIFGRAMVGGFTDAIEKQDTQYRKMQRRKKAMEKAQKKAQGGSENASSNNRSS